MVLTFENFCQTQQRYEQLEHLYRLVRDEREASKARVQGKISRKRHFYSNCI